MERKNSTKIAILALAMVIMIAVSVAAIQAVLWQGADLSVSIVSESDEGNKEVAISILNTAGSTLLFYENDQVTGVIEYLSDEGWVEYCDVCYTAGNAQAISPEYGGTFAELNPGEDWDVIIPEDKVAGMQSGTYRIKMTYITENRYNKYLNNAYEAHKAESEISDVSDDLSTDVSDVSDVSDISDVSGFVNTNEKAEGEVLDREEEEFLAASQSEVFIKNFEYTAPESLVKAISIDEDCIEE